MDFEGQNMSSFDDDASRCASNAMVYRSKAGLSQGSSATENLLWYFRQLLLLLLGHTHSSVVHIKVIRICTQVASIIYAMGFRTSPLITRVEWLTGTGLVI